MASADDELLGKFTVSDDLHVSGQDRECTGEQGEEDSGGAHDYKTSYKTRWDEGRILLK